MTACCVEGCEQPARFAVYAAYDDGPDLTVHPVVHRYPMPMWRCCAECVAGLMAADSGSLMSTRMFVVQATKETHA
jgi:hypothetical protein